jgi:monoamine oxidase
VADDHHERRASLTTSRRRLLAAGGLGAVALGARAAPAKAGQPAARTVDVVVVGAGFSGLAAARAIVRAGRSVAVLEARDRVGGRTKPGQIAGHTIDLGGMWVGPTQTRLLALGDEYGAKRYLSPIEGQNISEIKGTIRKGERGMPAVDDAALAEFMRVSAEIDDMSKTLSPNAPWAADRAREMDAITYSQWSRQVTSNGQTQQMLDAVAGAVFAADRSSFSLLYFLYYLKSGDDLATVMGIGDGAQKWLYHGGVHQIAHRIAAELGDRLVLGAPVRKVKQDETGVTVTSDAGVWRGRQAVVAVPPALCAQIDFQPALPSLRAKLCERFPMGSVIKFWVAYERPFWRDRGLNGLLFLDASAIGLTVDATPDGAPVGLIAGFFEGERAIEWGARSQAERKAKVVGEIARLLGPEGAKAIDYIDNDWPSEEWSRGCYGGVATPGTLSLFGQALREPAGRIHWAGTEASPVWTGYIDGAVRAGENAAAAALKSI